MKIVLVVLSVLFSLSVSAMEYIKFNSAGGEVIVKISVKADQDSDWNLRIIAGDKIKDIKGYGQKDFELTYAADELNNDIVATIIRYHNAIGGILLDVKFYQDNEHLDGDISLKSMDSNDIKGLSDSAFFVDKNLQ